jgi:HEAT repeat protein
MLNDRALEVSVRETAARSLGSIGDGSAVASLMTTLQDEAWVVREAGAASLEMLGWTPTGDTERAQDAVAKKDWEALVPLGEAAIEPLVDALKYGAVGLAAAQAMLKLGELGLDCLLNLLTDTSQPASVREVAARVLAETGDARAIEPVRAMLDEHDSIIRQVAVWALTRLGWIPANDRERALVAIANEDWDELGPLGSAAVEPLLALAEHSLAPEETARALRCVLTVSASLLSVQDLRAIAALGSVQAQEQIASAKYDGGIDLEAVAEAKAVRELASAELARRGIMV